MDRTCVDIFEGKKRALKEGDEAVSKQVGEGKDIMSILSAFTREDNAFRVLNSVIISVRANMEASEETKLPDNEVLGQVSLLQGSHIKFDLNFGVSRCRCRTLQAKF